MSQDATVKLATTGMHCGSCAMLIDMTLGDLAGVTTVSTDYGTGLTEVTFDSSSLSIEEIVAAVRAMGYEAEVI